ncbi:MAG: large conductance mechanosensitive channel protein MscL [Acidimicrobiia bacterium]
MIKEFKQFIARGNLVEIAVGLVIALAFVAVVASLVADVVTPVIGAIFGSRDFSGLTLTIWNDAVISYGAFLNALIAFLSVALAVFFLVVRPYNALKARMARGSAADEVAVEPSEEIVLLREIRDALRK